MTTIDWIIVGLAVVLGANGLRQGFIVGALQLAGFAAGAFAGSRVGPLVLHDGAHSPYAPLFALGGALLLGALLSALLESAGFALRSRVRLPGLDAADGGLGAALGVALALGLAWVVGAVALQTPGLELRRDIQRSVILRELNDRLPPSGFLLNALARFDPLPQVRGPGAGGVAAPEAAIARDPDVAGAAAGVVRVLGTACGLGIEGTGWVARPGVVVTNAHVVAGEDDTVVQERGTGPRLAARVVAFDVTNDVAVLRVPALGAPALPIAQDPPAGRSAAVLGFPHNGPFSVRAARLGPRARCSPRTPTAAARCAARSRPSAGWCARATPAARSSTAPGAWWRRSSRRPSERARGPATGCRTRGCATRSRRPGRAGCRRVPARDSGPRPALWSAPHGQDPRHRGEAVGRARPRARPPGPVREEEDGRGEDRALARGPRARHQLGGRHLVQLAEPDEYDDKFKKWRMADLPIVPDRFKLVVRDERSQKQMTAVKNLLRRDDVDLVVNACDAGREGELIFAYLYEKAAAKKPVKRLWLSSMTEEAMRDALAHLRDADELKLLEAAARSRSEADWIVGMNATRAATIRLRSSFDGAVSLGRVQTPTLAILTRREEEIRAFVPEKYWLVDAAFEAEGARRYEGRFHAGAQPRLPSAEEAEAIAAAVRGQRGTITKLTKTTRREKAPLLYDLTSLQREANNRYGFSARRTLGAAQRLYEEHKALTYPRTNSRYLPGDMIAELKPIAGHVGRHHEYAAAAAYVRGLDLLPLGRVVDDAKVTDHHAIIPTNAQHVLDKMSSDDRRVYDMVARRFLAAFHPEAVFENTRVETTVAEHVFRTRGKVLVEPGWRGVYGELAEGEGAADADDEGRDQQLPKLEQGEDVDTREAATLEKETQPPRRYSDASLLGAMETAGKLVDEDEAREAMKESGIGTPATRAAIIERLIDVGYVERDGRALVPTEKGMNVIRLLGEHPLTSPQLTGEWEHRLTAIEDGQETRKAFMADIAKFAGSTVGELDAKLKDVKIPRANLGPCPVCGNDIIENRKGYSCWSREDPGAGS